jgi:hypothetical protein
MYTGVTVEVNDKTDYVVARPDKIGAWRSKAWLDGDKYCFRLPRLPINIGILAKTCKKNARLHNDNRVVR